jgi:threonine dehydrogenase-like Zn-dependent dehydrogenase
MKNNCLVFKGAYDIELLEKDLPVQLEMNEVLVKIKATGICGTDIGIVSGNYLAAKPNIVIGHESSGIVVAMGEKVKNTKIGSRVFINPTYYCEQCLYCRTGRQNHCAEKAHTETGVSQDGTFSNYYITEERFLYEMNDEITFAEASLAEPLSCVLTGVNQLKNVRMDARALIFGAGPMGILYAHALALHGLKGTIIEISEKRLELLKHVLPKEWGASSSLAEAQAAIPNEEFDLIIDTSSSMLKTSLQHLARGGEILLVGLRNQQVEINPMCLADKSQSIIGSIDTIGTFNIACDLINHKRLPAKDLITDQFNLVNYKEAFEKVGVNFNHKVVTPNASGIKVVILQ